jgi:hypothetical protein
VLSFALLASGSQVKSSLLGRILALFISNYLFVRSLSPFLELGNGLGMFLFLITGIGAFSELFFLLLAVCSALLAELNVC